MYPQVSYPERCPSCATPEGYVQKPIPTHKYGDYVILRPDEESTRKLEQLAKATGNLIQEQLGLPPGEVVVNPSDRMHLTLAMPLNPLSKDEALGLLSAIRAKVIENGMDHKLVKFDLVFRGQKDGGSSGFSFTSPNFAPGFDIRLKEPAKAYNGHNEGSPHAAMSSLAGKIQEYCETKHLVSLERNENGKCNSFNPHISLGKLNSHEVCKKLHNRVQHRPEGAAAMSHLASVRASDTFKCADSSHRHCSTLPLRFKTIEILRVDSDEGEMGAPHLLARYDLTNDQMAMVASFPTCSHKIAEKEKENLPKDLMASLGKMQISQSAAKPTPYKQPSIQAPSATYSVASPQGSYVRNTSPAIKEIESWINCTILDAIATGFELRYGTDYQGVPMVDVLFEEKWLAEYILKHVDNRVSSKIHEVGGKYVVKLGPQRCQTMFGERGKEVYANAVAHLKAHGI